MTNLPNRHSETNCPNVYLTVSATADGRQRVTATAQLERLRPRSFELWSQGRLVSQCEIPEGCAWDLGVDLDIAEPLHAWLHAGDVSVYCGIINGVSPYAKNETLRFEVAGHRDYVAGLVEFTVQGADDYDIFINGRLARELADFLPSQRPHTFRGRITTRTSLLVLEVVARDGRSARMPLWRWRLPGFELFREAFRSRQYCDVHLAGGEFVRDAVPIQIAAEDDGWKCYFRLDESKFYVKVPEEDISDIDISERTFALTGEDKKKRASIDSSRDFFQTASEAFFQPIAVTSAKYTSIKRLNEKRRIVVLRPRPLPTDEIYIMEPLAPLCRQGKCEIVCVDTGALPPDSAAFDGADVIIVVRYINRAWMSEVAKQKAKTPIVYLFDDDIPAAIDTESLPSVYRRVMADVALCDFQYLMYVADFRIVSSPYLAERFRSPRTYLLEPPSLHESKSLDHHLDGRKLRIGYHGSNTHYRDLEFIIPQLKQVGEEYQNIEFEIFGHKGLSETLKQAIPSVNFVNALPWNTYKEFRRQRPCHIMLSPLIDTPYNGGKSRIKFCDASSLGAAGIYSDVGIYGAVVDGGVDGLLVKNEGSAWREALDTLISNRQLTYEIADACRTANRQKCSIEEATTFWAELLGLAGA